MAQQQIQKNEAQEEAIRTINGPVLLVSCPGSGKTTTMLRRISNMVDQGIDPASILMVTFTEAAAKEMKKRYEAINGDTPVTFCTIHSLCLRMMYTTGMSDFHIMDASEVDEAVKAASSVMRKYFEDTKNIKNDISLYKNTGSLEGRSELSLSQSDFVTFVKAYENYKAETGGVDFDDLLIHGKRLLTERPNVLRSFRNKFRYIICDEYQDTNPIQQEILYLLAGKNGNLCVVGDDDQSIYGFRGAVPSIMMEFPKDFPGCKVIHMSTNYRSVPGIIEPSATLIMNNKKRFAKDIVAFRQAGSVTPVTYDMANDRDGEMERLAAAVRKMAGARGTEYKTCAVLARTNAQLEQVAGVFTEKAIPFSSRDVVKDIYEHFSFDDIRAYLRLADGSGGMADFLRVMNRPKRYLSPRMFTNIPYEESQVTRAVFRGGKDYAVDKILEYFRLIKRLGELPFKDRVPFILNQIKYSEYLYEYADNTGIPTAAMDARCSAFARDAASCGSLPEWEKYARRHAKGFHETVDAHREDGVVLATMHRAKGLEWDHVFIIDCCDGTVPYERKGATCDLEEERRLFYVACTRARETLHVMNYGTSKDKEGKEHPVAPSRFVNEMQVNRGRAASLAERTKLRNDNISGMRSGFQTDDLSSFTKGELVHHVSLGSGTVISNRSGILSVRFRTGVRTFTY